MVLKKSTAVHLPVLRNISSSKQGQYCERIAQEYFQKKFYRIVGANQKIAGVEVDLILFKGIFTLVEVKSLGNTDEISFRISKKQIKRLLFARDYFSQLKDQAVELKVLFVMAEDNIELDIEDLL